MLDSSPSPIFFFFFLGGGGGGGGGPDARKHMKKIKLINLNNYMCTH